MKNKFKNVMAIWSLIVMAVYPVLFLYGQNFNEISFEEVRHPAFVLVCGYTFVFLISFCVIRKLSRTVLFTAVVIILGNFFAVFLKGGQLLIPSIKYWHMLSLMLMVCYLMISVVKKHISDEGINIGILLLIILANFYLVINMFPLAINIAKNIPLNTAAEKENKAENVNSPNIYYLVFDEYSSNEFMQKYYNYDNSDLVDKLKKMDFNVSLSSSNEAYMTKICMTNTFNLDYLFDMKDNDDKSKNDIIDEKRKNNLLFQILKERGYDISAIGNADFYGLEDASSAATIEKATLDGRSFEQLALQRTVLYPFVKSNSSIKLQSIEKNRDYINNIKLIPNTGKFVLFHIELPHTAFVVDQDGNLISAENRLNWENKKYYLGQYIYASNMMLDIVSNIIEKDKEAIIVLSSDHSARGLDEFSEIDRCQIFNAVYFQGKRLDIEGLSGINTLRTILNELFDYNYEMLETVPLGPAKE